MIEGLSEHAEYVCYDELINLFFENHPHRCCVVHGTFEIDISLEMDSREFRQWLQIDQFLFLWKLIWNSQLWNTS